MGIRVYAGGVFLGNRTDIPDGFNGCRIPYRADGRYGADVDCRLGVPGQQTICNDGIFYHITLVYIVCGYGIGHEYVRENDRDFSYAHGAEIYCKNAGKIFILLAVCYFGILMPPKAEDLASHFSGKKFPPSVGMEALEMIINLVLDLIILLLVIFTLGCASIMYFARIAQFVHKSDKAIKTMRKIMKIAEDARKRAKKLQKAAKQAKFKTSMLG